MVINDNTRDTFAFQVRLSGKTAKNLAAYVLKTPGTAISVGTKFGGAAASLLP